MVLRRWQGQGDECAAVSAVDAGPPPPRVQTGAPAVATSMPPPESSFASPPHATDARSARWHPASGAARCAATRRNRQRAADGGAPPLTYMDLNLTVSVASLPAPSPEQTCCRRHRWRSLQDGGRQGRRGCWRWSFVVDQTTHACHCKLPCANCRAQRHAMRAHMSSP